MSEGFLYINKPRGISSFAVIYRVRKITGVKRVGHAGTLDPEADGLLIVAVGRGYTKQLTKWLKKGKEYRATIKLGYESTTGDVEGVMTEINTKLKPTEEDVKEALKKFVGEIKQIPSAYSAIKIGGQRAYDLARKGEAVVMPSRDVTVYKLNLLSYNYPEIEALAGVSSGTYIRTLSEDIGRALGTGAFMSALTRTKIDQVDLSDSIALKDLNEENWVNYLHQ